MLFILKKQGTEVEGSILELQKISRLDMGVYLCIGTKTSFQNSEVSVNDFEPEYLSF